MVATHLRHGAEIYTAEGPTGRFASVESGEVQDFGGNVLFSGTADECALAHGRFRTATRLVPTRWMAVSGEVAGADNHWQPVID